MSGIAAQSIWQQPTPKPVTRMNLRYIDWIWHVRDSVPLPEGQTTGEALDRLEPMLDQMDTTHERSEDTLTFHRKAPVPQDPLSVFEDGVLQIAETAQGKTLRYHLVSKALLFCFLLPLLFVGFGQLTLYVGAYQKAAAEAKEKAGGDKKKKDEAKVLELNPIDKMLGAPAPEKPKKGEGEGRKPSATAAYVFAGIFAFLYVVGRFLEPWLVRRRFRARLADA
ncbi:hypothetical protein [Novosphingobium sp. 17-62-19]|uniref:hypothetical protein n=1 Tax=Novosphingobium sp. 17-62-19 TaxID=1970406 RepID=UPI0025E3B3B6|nr:hypothetical protein [Novosphingobium sp. 17-62-19]HQS97414.1 hypothetical protein [Novosphingobium sp.]